MQTAMTRALDALEARVGDIDAFVAQRLNYSIDELRGTKHLKAISLRSSA